MERSNGAVKTAFDIQVNGKHGPGRPKMTWKQLTERDRREWKLSAIVMKETPGDLPCVQQASCLEGGPLLWIWPLYLHVNQKSDDDDDEPLCHRELIFRDLPSNNMLISDNSRVRKIIS